MFSMAKSSPAGIRPATWLVPFGRRLRLARVRAGLTQQRLGAPDLTKSFMSLLETGRSYPSVETVLALARRLCVSVGSLTLDPAGLRFDTALDLLHLAWEADPAQGPSVLAYAATAERLLPEMPDELRALALLIRARVALAAGDMRKAARLTRGAAQLSHRTDHTLGRVLAIQGIVEERRGAFDRAATLLERAVTIMRKAKSFRSEEGVWASLSLGVARARTGDIRRAERAYRQAYDLAARLELPRLKGRAVTGLGMMHWARQRHDRATEFLSHAHDIFEQLEDLNEMGRVLTNLGRVRLEQGLHREALIVLGKALRIRERQRDLRGVSATLDELASVYAAMGRWSEAGQVARRALRTARAAQDQAREGIAGVTLARVLDSQKRPREAARVRRKAVAMLKRLGMRREAAAALKEPRTGARSGADSPTSVLYAESRGNASP
jgi:tetratricopeptide (TPR) repeat protein